MFSPPADEYTQENALDFLLQILAVGIYKFNWLSERATQNAVLHTERKIAFVVACKVV